ncbi:hypothetical protein BS78_10G026900 [Paspalum vaginatum]|nr:hypothetical protein BS78_10G026900 [Paspalum vaginatum]
MSEANHAHLAGGSDSSSSQCSRPGGAQSLVPHHRWCHGRLLDSACWGRPVERASGASSWLVAGRAYMRGCDRGAYRRRVIGCMQRVGPTVHLGSFACLWSVPRPVARGLPNFASRMGSEFYERPKSVVFSTEPVLHLACLVPTSAVRSKSPYGKSNHFAAIDEPQALLTSWPLSQLVKGQSLLEFGL